jgi:HAD superfamily hydrolase (TIGR01549 family)
LWFCLNSTNEFSGSIPLDLPFVRFICYRSTIGLIFWVCEDSQTINRIYMFRSTSTSIFFLVVMILSRSIQVYPLLINYSRFFSRVKNITYTNNSAKMFRSTNFTLQSPKGVIFDMDGTLTEPHLIDFKAMYSRNGLEKHPTDDILALVAKLPTEEERLSAMRIIEEEELLGCERMQFRPNMHDVLTHLQSVKIPMAVATRNCQFAYEKFIEKASLPTAFFHPVLHRDSLNGINKPDPAVAHHILRHWNIASEDASAVWFVGDSLDDVACGKAAGCSTCLILTGSNHVVHKNHPHLVDIVVNDLMEFLDVLKPALSPSTDSK